MRQLDWLFPFYALHPCSLFWINNPVRRKFHSSLAKNIMGCDARILWAPMNNSQETVHRAQKKQSFILNMNTSQMLASVKWWKIYCCLTEKMWSVTVSIWLNSFWIWNAYSKRHNCFILDAHLCWKLSRDIIDKGAWGKRPFPLGPFLFHFHAVFGLVH